MTRTRFAVMMVAAAAATSTSAAAQPLGTFRWQLQPYCNVITVTVTQVGSLYRVEGSDDLCGAGRAASVIGTAYPNPDGTVGMGLNIVSVPNGQPQPVAAVLSLATLGGSWSGAGSSGSFTFTPGSGTGGSPRPAPASNASIPAVFRLETDGGFLAGGSFGSGSIPASGAGTRLMWHPSKAAIRAGRVDATAWDNANIGNESAAFNKNTRAIGTFSFAVNDSTLASGSSSFASGAFTTASGGASFAGGSGTTASGQHTVAMGQGTIAIGNQSVALGLNTAATGNHALAMGDGTIASGGNSFVTGALSQANGFESVAMGLRVLAGGIGSVVLGSDAVAQAAASGTFIFGDRSTTNDITGFAPNQFLVRAAGGVGIYTNAALTLGVELDPNDGTWNVVSDVNMKEAFTELAGEDVLSKLAGMPIREWSYKGRGSSVRHVGPTAQDFHGAFGLGTNALRISTVDADGIALRAIQALEARTRHLATVEADAAKMIERLLALEQEVARLRELTRQ